MGKFEDLVSEMARKVDFIFDHLCSLDEKEKFFEQSDSFSYSVKVMARDENFMKKLKTPLYDIPMSTRALKCLKAADIETLGDLVQWRRNDLLKIRNVGNKCVDEYELIAKSFGLRLDMGEEIGMLIKYRKVMKLC